MNRRGFLDLLIRLSGTAVGAFVLYPVVRYLIPPPSPEAATRRVVAARKNELAPGGFKIFPFGGQPGLIIRNADGSYCAFTAVCTHLGCTVRAEAPGQFHALPVLGHAMYVPEIKANSDEVRVRVLDR